MHKNTSDLKPLEFLVHQSDRVHEAAHSPPSPYLPLSDQLSLQMVNLEEGPAGGDGADRPDRPYGSPEGSGETFDLYCGPIPKASADVTAAHGQRLVQAVVQRGRPRCLQVRVRFDPEGHLEASGTALREQDLCSRRRRRECSQFHVSGWISSCVSFSIYVLRNVSGQTCRDAASSE